MFEGRYFDFEANYFSERRVKMDKYDVYVFPNGRVVLIDSDTISEAINAGKEVLIVCNAWSGGYAYAVGANAYCDPHFGKCYAMYAYDIRDREFTPDELSGFHKVIFTSGEKIYMETGDQANRYTRGKFSDMDTSDCRAIERNGYVQLTPDEIRKKRETINERATVRHIYKDREAKVQTMINKGILSENAKKYI